MKEMVALFYDKIKDLTDRQYLEKHLKYQLAPVIKGVKPSATLNIRSHKAMHQIWNLYGQKIIEDSGLKVALLRESYQTIIFFIYNPVLIENILRDPYTAVFLAKLGYPLKTAEESAYYLTKRYKKYHCPHELGLFLGIPLQDVKDFMDCTQKKCLLCGYWKVYNNINEAKKIFKQYDQAKEEMLGELLKQLEDIAS